MMKQANPRCSIPSEKYFRTVMMPDIYEKVKLEVKETLQNVNYISFTTDMWTSQSMQSYASLTAHFINEDWQRKTVVLGCLVYSQESHSAGSIAQFLREILEDWNLTNKIHAFVRDNDIKLVNALKINGWPSIGCFLHTLQLVVNKSTLAQSGAVKLISKAQSIAKKFRNSTIAKAALERHQSNNNLAHQVLLMSNDTRWSSVYDMLNRLQEQKRPLRDYFDENPSPELEISDYEWKILQSVLNLLKPFKSATVYGQREDSCISEVIPHIQKIKRSLSNADATFCGTTHSEIEKLINQYFGGGDKRDHFVNVEDTDDYSVATFLDPRFKTAKFTDKNKTILAKHALTTFLTAPMTINPDVSADLSPKPKKSKSSGKEDNFWSSSDEDDQSTYADSSPLVGSSSSILQMSAEIERQILTYLNDKAIPSSDDPLQYYKVNGYKFPLLARAAKKYLSAPCGNASSEREFSTVSDIANYERNRMLPENVDKLVFLKYNLRETGFNTIDFMC